jgi:Mg-chelatase subunit ChlD
MHMYGAVAHNAVRTFRGNSCVLDLRLEQSKESGGAEAGHNTLSFAREAELTHLMRQVAGLNDVSVRIGESGRGSYANLEKRHIVLAMDHALQEMAPFVAAHEGAHLRWTPRLQDIPLTPEQIEATIKKIGLLPLINVIEDGAINNGLLRDFQQVSPNMSAAYPRVQPGEPASSIDHPQVRDVIERMGFVPRFAVGLGALLSDWSESMHAGQSLKVPVSGEVPVYRGAEISDPDIRQFVDRTLSYVRVAESQIPPMGSSGSDKLTAGRNRFLYCDQLIYPELKKLLDKDIQQLAETLAQQAGQESQSQAGNEQGAKQAKDSSPGEGAESESETGAEKSGNPEPGPSEAPSPDPKSKDSNGAPPDPESQRRARELLSELDDAIRDALRPLLDADKQSVPSTAAAVREANNAERQAEREEADRQARELAAKAVRESFLRTLTGWERLAFEVQGQVEEAHGRLADVLVPAAHFNWEPGHASGSKINLDAALRFEATGQGSDSLFMRRLDPQNPDLAVALLIDCSGSMEGERIQEAQKATAFLVELMRVRLELPLVTIRFANEPSVLAGTEDDYRESEVQERILSGLVARGSTNDASAIHRACKALSNIPSSGRIVLMISDAESSVKDKLVRALANADQQGILVVHFGIGPGTSDNQGLYARSFGDLTTANSGQRGPSDFFRVFASEVEKLVLENFQGDDL